MTARAVHWNDGMFLRPHHFQVAERYAQHLAQRNEQWGMHYGWGLREIDIDLDALANHRFAVRSLRARLRDGAAVSVPEDGLLPSLDLKAALEAEASVTVFLAVPVLNLGKPNVPAEGSNEDPRFLIQTQELEDENTGVNPQKILVRSLNLKLLTSGQDQTGFEALPIARLEKSQGPEGGPQLDLAYIPPVIACDAWRPLQADILQSLCDRIGKKIDALAEQALARGVTFDSHVQGDQQLFAQLRSLNESHPGLRTLSFAHGIHPLDAYLRLCDLMGKLSIYDESRRPAEAPLYDHDDLAGCFYGVKRYIDALLARAVEAEYQERAFVGTGLRMQASLEPKWMEAGTQLFIGVRSSASLEECVRLLTEPGQLDVKVGSSDRVDSLFRLGQAGLRFSHAPAPPRVLPSLPDLTYFQISRSAPATEWQNVQRSLTLALRLNEHLIVGNIQGQRVLKIRTAGQTTTMQFTLYVVPGAGL
jgi:type VI secretion system protein ImpJ